MTPDISRQSFDSRKHFSRVIQQQGRVLLDADWNEQNAILLHYLRTIVTDLIGPGAGPPDSQTDLNFKITWDPASPKQPDLLIGPGRYYVDGYLCECNPGVSYLKQPWLNVVVDKDHPFPPPFPLLAYLDVWESTITALEDPSILEVGLGGIDTTARARVFWRVRLEALEEKKSAAPATGAAPAATSAAVTADEHDAVNDAITALRSAHDNAAWMRAKVAPPADVSVDDPCAISPSALYRGTENQLYRVEIHSGTSSDGKSVPTFKWSRDNGAIAFLLRSLQPNGDAGSWTAKLADFGRDNTRFGLDVGDWVEVLDASSNRAEASALDNPSSNEVRDLLQVAALNPTDMSVTLVRPLDSSQKIVGVPLDTELSYDEASARSLRAYLRRWDQTKGVVGKKTDPRLPLGVIPIVDPSAKWTPILDLDALGLSPNGERPTDSGKFADASPNYKPANDASWITLEDGIKIQFQQRPDASDPNSPAQNSSPVTFRAGDHWLIPARTASNGRILWPNQKNENGDDLLDKQKQVIPLPKPPDGVVHHYAALAIIASLSETKGLRSTIVPPIEGA